MKSPEAEHEPNPCVYLVFSQGIVKIGRTINLENRVSSLKRAEYPEGVKGFGPIEEILYIKTEYPMRLESMIHSLLEPEHVTGEWFHLKQDDISALQSLFKGSIGTFQTHQEEKLELHVYNPFHKRYADIRELYAEIPPFTIIDPVHGERSPTEQELREYYSELGIKYPDDFEDLEDEY